MWMKRRAVCVKFKVVFTAVLWKIQVLWAIMMCQRNTFCRVERLLCPHIKGQGMDYSLTQCHITEDWNLQGVSL